MLIVFMGQGGTGKAPAAQEFAKLTEVRILRRLDFIKPDDEGNLFARKALTDTLHEAQDNPQLAGSVVYMANGVAPAIKLRGMFPRAVFIKFEGTFEEIEERYRKQFGYIAKQLAHTMRLEFERWRELPADLTLDNTVEDPAGCARKIFAYLCDRD